jgi:uncharacterized protein YjaG (DUF416 family)
LDGVVALMTSHPVDAYDEQAIKARLEAAGRRECSLFAASCAERLFPMYEAFVKRTGQGDVELLRRALDFAWDVVGATEHPVAEIAAHGADAELLVPSDDDEDWTEASPIAQNAAAAVAYALRTQLSGDSQDGVWAARQLYEAADFLVQLAEADHTYVQSADKEDPVAVAVAGISAALDGLGMQSASEFKTSAREGGERLRALLQDPPSGGVLR